MSSRETAYDRAPYGADVMKGHTWLGKPHARGLDIARRAGVNPQVAEVVLGYVTEAAKTGHQVIFSHEAVRRMAKAKDPAQAMRVGTESVAATINAGERRVSVHGPAAKLFGKLR